MLIVTCGVTGRVASAARTFVVSGVADPFVRYVRNEREPTFIERVSERLRIMLYLLICIRTKVTLTVNAGIANVVGVPPKNPSDKKDLVTRFAEFLTGILRWSRDRMMTDAEERKRRKEFEEKITEAMKRSIGDRVDKMWYIEGLCTDPLSQGQGYGGALLDAVTTLADRAGQATWLQSSNVANKKFYNEHGFEVVETVVVGDQNPTWHGQPVPISLMVREPRYSVESLVNVAIT